MTDPVDLNGFTGWVTFADLANTDIPTDPGVYIVMRPIDGPPQFLACAPYKGDLAVPVAELEAGWVAEARILYIGKANHGVQQEGLHRRLRQFRRYGVGGSARHSGGRRIWQLADCNELLVGWRVTDDAEARVVEKAMIAQFRAHYGAWPFANRRD